MTIYFKIKSGQSCLSVCYVLWHVKVNFFLIDKKKYEDEEEDDNDNGDYDNDDEDYDKDDDYDDNDDENDNDDDNKFDRVVHFDSKFFNYICDHNNQPILLYSEDNWI